MFLNYLSIQSKSHLRANYLMIMWGILVSWRNDTNIFGSKFFCREAQKCGLSQKGCRFPKIMPETQLWSLQLGAGSRISQTACQPREANLIFGQIFVTTAWKWKKLARGASKMLHCRFATDLVFLCKFYFLRKNHILFTSDGFSTNGLHSVYRWGCLHRYSSTYH